MPISFRIRKRSLRNALNKTGPNTEPRGSPKRLNRRFCPYTGECGSVKNPHSDIFYAVSFAFLTLFLRKYLLRILLKKFRILSEALAPKLKEDLARLMVSDLFSMVTDSSSDTNVEKINPYL